jgi:cytochrome oxidase Cu insertion factor (SCO1/SenC/PrrC family)
MKHCILVLFSLLALTVSVAAQEQKNDSLPATDLERVSVGVEAPDFTLADQEGKSVKLSQFRGRKSVVLVFYRGYW